MLRSRSCSWAALVSWAHKEACSCCSVTRAASSSSSSCASWARKSASFSFTSCFSNSTCQRGSMVTLSRERIPSPQTLPGLTPLNPCANLDWGWEDFSRLSSPAGREGSGMSVTLGLTYMPTYGLLTHGPGLCKWALSLVPLATMPAPCYD